MTKDMTLAEIIAKTFGADREETLIVQHPWTNSIWIFQDTKTPEDGCALAFKISADGTVTSLDQITVVPSAYYTSYRSLNDDFDISVSTRPDTDLSEQTHYSALDGTPGPYLKTLRSGLPGGKPVQSALKF